VIWRNEMHFWIQHNEISKTHLFWFLPQKKSFFLQASELTNQLTNCLNIWSRVLLDKLTGSQLVKSPPYCMEPEGSLPHLQVKVLKNVSEFAVCIPNFHSGLVFCIYFNGMTILKKHANLMVDKDWLRLTPFHCCIPPACYLFGSINS
jgi:hypothetical protein